MKCGGRIERSTSELRRTLDKRMRELDCLYGISEVSSRSSVSLEAKVQAIANLLPTAWESPTSCCARIVLDGSEFKTQNFSDCRWKLVAELCVHGESAGFVEVGLPEQKRTRTESPFLAEERRLLNSVAERTGHIVERMRAAQSFRQREAELRGRLTHLTRVSTMGEMASNIAHEVNQPLTAIATYTQACTRMLNAGTTNTGELLGILKRVTDEALRAGGIIHHLQDLARRRGSTRTVCDVNELVRDLEHLAAVDTRLHNVRLELQLSDSLPMVLADRIQIQQVVLNLIRNGIDAMTDCDPENRDLVVRTAMLDEDMVEISVADTGCGLPENCEEELFQPFFTTKNDGMGMGLSVSWSIVTSHGGQMWFTRNEDRGATFFLSIPVAPEEDNG